MLGMSISVVCVAGTPGGLASGKEVGVAQWVVPKNE